MTNRPFFHLNGRDIPLADTDPTESLLRWLRRAHLTGTKEGCADGDCGACTVAIVESAEDGGATYRAVNSCLLPMGSVPGRRVVTVESLADGDTLHPVQAAMVRCAGSQCGYCTPGIVMSLFAGYYNGELTDITTEGNLCRCTGYRPIRAATDELAGDSRPDDAFCRALHADVGGASDPIPAFHLPVSVDQAIALKRDNPQAAWIAGATDLGVALSHGQPVAPSFIALDRIAALRHIDIQAGHVLIGAGVPLTTIETQLAGLFPALDQMLYWFAARQVRNRATLGGNLGTASPIGDLLPVLLALDAQVHCAGPEGARTLPVSDFFTGYRKTRRADGELIVAVTLPRRSGLSAAYKVAKRQTDDISIVAAVFALDFDQDIIAHARLAYGGVAATPMRATAVEEFLLGRTLDTDTVAEACRRLESVFTPLDDHRSSAAYRRRLCGSLFAKFVQEHCR
ncbi:xanthine dehydrogenase small subunit [Tahibacter amnicola]|uniref:FAD binding domain-containing protein n=1 Tax=Tahibacter amnicola TaxID=2976241 RepID=A0ABY6BFV8_9GAMM|nr:FAD binding domain-containing protein [Tahibacter amnicola]UXI68672.1 FAD binding domain-containing protein [Tahibacter amnicola]